MEQKTAIIVCGAAGRMGSLITELALRDGGFDIKAGIEIAGHPLAGKKSPAGVDITDNADAVITGNEVVIDFSAPEAAVRYLNICMGKKSPFVTGTTGLNPEQYFLIKKAAGTMPVFYAPNMSIGVNLFFEIVKSAAGLLKEYEVEISEIHHRFKKDAPSGTAKKIADIICSASGRDVSKVIRYGREGIAGERTCAEIGMHSLRMGDVVGEHYVYFGGEGELVELSHRCYNRASFALGALKAARFIRNKPAGLYNMENLIKELANL